MDKTFPGNKKPQDLTAEEMEALDRTDKFIAPLETPEESEESLAHIIERTSLKEEELKQSVRDSLGTIMEGPVHVLSFRYVGNGRFECVVAYGKGQRKTVVVKEQERKVE